MGSAPGGGGGQRAFGTGYGTEMSPGAMGYYLNRLNSGAGLTGMFGIGARNTPAPNYTLGGPNGTTPIAPTTTGTATSGPALPPPMVVPQAAPRADLAAIMAGIMQQASTGRSAASMRR